MEDYAWLCIYARIDDALNSACARVRTTPSGGHNCWRIRCSPRCGTAVGRPGSAGLIRSLRAWLTAADWQASRADDAGVAAGRVAADAAPGRRFKQIRIGSAVVAVMASWPRPGRASPADGVHVVTDRAGTAHDEAGQGSRRA